jgi:hypothetical protein
VSKADAWLRGRRDAWSLRARIGELKTDWRYDGILHELEQLAQRREDALCLLPRS